MAGLTCGVAASTRSVALIMACSLSCSLIVSTLSTGGIDHRARFPCLAAYERSSLATGILRMRGGGSAEGGVPRTKTRASEKSSGNKKNSPRPGSKSKKRSSVGGHDSAPSSIVDEIEAELTALNSARGSQVPLPKQSAGDADAKPKSRETSALSAKGSGHRRDSPLADANGKRSSKNLVRAREGTAATTRTLGSNRKMRDAASNMQATTRTEWGVVKTKVKKKKRTHPVTAEAIRLNEFPAQPSLHLRTDLSVMEPRSWHATD